MATPQPHPTLQRPAWLAEQQFPFTSRFVDVDGQTVHYVDEGSGATLLFVHAGPAWSFIFRDLIARLRHDFRCVACDFPGSGLSPARPGEQPTMAASARLLERFTETLELDRVTLVVHDVGGPVALATAARHPERVAGLAVAESFGWSLGDENRRVARALWVVSRRPVRWLNTVTNIVATLTASRYGAGRRLDRAGRAAFLGPYRDRAVRRRSTAMLADAMTDQALLRSVDTALRTTLAHLPVLLIFGSRSPTVKGGFPTSWTTRFPEAPLFLLEGGHHFPMMDDPGAVADVIGSWWDAAVQPATGQPAPPPS
ncbi:MAG: alpha/beta fold hydrolase [Actinobacteria bacterium]|nr:alpha/beta fold hydrolase [Actinomycetota bacterium]